MHTEGEFRSATSDDGNTFLLLRWLCTQEVIDHWNDYRSAVHQRDVSCVRQNGQTGFGARLHVAMNIAAYRNEDGRDDPARVLGLSHARRGLSPKCGCFPLEPQRFPQRLDSSRCRRTPTIVDHPR